MTEQIRPGESGSPFFPANTAYTRSLQTEKDRKEEDRPQRTAAYIRVSTGRSSQEDSYELQYRYFTELLAQHPGWISAGVYADYGKSGTSWENRRGFCRLLRHCQEGRIDHIVTKSISRFARNTRDFLKALEVLRENQVTIAFEKEHLDTSIVQNDLLLTGFGAFAQEESRSASENIRQSLRRRYPRGEAPNLPVYGYRYAKGADSCEILDSGYRRRKVEPVEAEAETVRRIFREAAAGKGYVEIARGLNADGIPEPLQRPGRLGEKADKMQKTSGQQGVQQAESCRRAAAGKLKTGLDEGWTDRHIRQILRQERYCGDVLLQKTYKPDYRSRHSRLNKGELPQYYVQNHHPAIISRELYGEARERRPSRTGSERRKTSYPFSGRLICAHCGRFYSTRNRSSRPIWYCTSTGRNTGKTVCQAARIYEEQLIRVCRRAIAERFGLAQNRQRDIETLRAGISHRANSLYTAPDPDFAADTCSMVENLLRQLEWLEQADDIERLALLYGNKEWTEAGRDVERYWRTLEEDYIWRQQAIAWMKTLPPGWDGVSAFLDGLTDQYVKAFILELEIWSPLQYRVHWFDNTWTEVKMHSNVE